MSRALLLLAVSAMGCVTTYHGIVYSDHNGNGKRDDGEPGVAHTVVAFGDAVFGETDADGKFDLQVLDGSDGFVWARVPDGYRPGAAYSRMTSDPIEVGLPPLAQRITQPFSFVVASDSHVGGSQPFSGDLRAALVGMTAAAKQPAFAVITGDLTQDDMDGSYDLFDAARSDLAVPYVTVNGNHDWYSGGATWARREGPANYSFDIGNVHFVVWNMMAATPEILDYLGLELARVDPAMTIVAMSHAPPVPAIIAKLKALHVDYVLTGHTHTNRAVDHGGMVELTTEPLLMGGLDQLPGGYRIVTIDQQGKLTATHRTTVDGPQLAVIAPTAATCVPTSGARAILAAELDAGEPTIEATIDCGTPIAFARAGGGWSWSAELPPLSPGWHSFTVTARAPSGLAATRALSFEVCDAPAITAPTTASWPQTGGSSSHEAVSPAAIAPPLAPVWAATVGGNIVHAPPAVGDGAVFVTATDLGDGTAGGLVAFELATGEQRWRVTTPLPVRGGAAVIGTTVAIGELDGTVLALDTRTGSQLWTAALGAGLAPEAASFFASAAAEGTDFFLGNQRRFAALDATTGTPRWMIDPVPTGSYSQALAAAAIAPASVTLPGGIVVGVFHRDDHGLQAWRRDTGALQWAFPIEGLEATPVIANDTVYVIDGQASVSALAAGTGARKWQNKIADAGDPWRQLSVGQPAIAADVLVVPTMAQDLVALDARTGVVLWRHAGRPSPLRTNHYPMQDGRSGFESGPVIAGGTVWAVDTSGHLSALDLHTGALQWETDLDVPVLAGLAIAGDWLIVASYDGSVRALAPTTRVVTPPPPLTCMVSPEAPFDDDPATGAGGCSTSGSGSPLAAAGFAALVLGCRKRRRRRRS